MNPFFDEARRQQTAERTILSDGTVIAEIGWAEANRPNASAEDLMLKCVREAKAPVTGKLIDAKFLPGSGGLSIEISDEGVGRIIPVKSLVDRYLSASGEPHEREAAVRRFVRTELGYRE